MYFVWNENALAKERFIAEEIFAAAGVNKTDVLVENQLFENKNKVRGRAETFVNNIVTEEVDQLHLKNELREQQLIIEEKEKLIALAHKLAHDISSPLTALSMVAYQCSELPKNKRELLVKTIASILDITKTFLSSYRPEKSSSRPAVEPRQSLLVVDLLVQLLNEKRIQYQRYPVAFETKLADDANVACIQIQKTEFRRTISNLINNAVDALEGKKNGVISVQLSTNANFVTVKVQDNGKGMSRDNVEKILERRSFTKDKEDGHGLGLQQVFDTLEHNQGAVAVQSELGKGTFIQLTFPRITPSC